MTVAEMASGLSASEAHLAKVLQRLTKAGIVSSTRGPRGGFRLTSSPASVSLRKVYEAMEGRLEVERCMVGSPICNKRECPLGSLFARLSDDVMDTLGATTLADIELPLERGLKRARR